MGIEIKDELRVRRLTITEKLEVINPNLPAGLLKTDGSTTTSAGGGGVAWGDVTGTLSAQTDLQSALNAKEPTITTGTTGQYFRGDKTWQTLDKAAVGLGSVANADTTNAANISSGTLATARLGSGTANSTTFLRGDNTWATPGGLVNFTESNATYSSVTYVRLLATNAATNVPVVISPKGTGAFYLGAPADGTATGGNNRGASAIDLQLRREANNQVASSDDSICIGWSNRATNASAIAIGARNVATGSSGIAIGITCTASGASSFAVGQDNTTSSTHGTAFGYGNTTTRHGGVTYGANYIAIGKRQGALYIATNQSTSTSNVELFLDNSSARITLAQDQVIGFQIEAVYSDGTEAKTGQLIRRGLIKRDGGAGTTALVGSVQTVGTDISGGSGLGAITVNADTTNGALRIQVNSGETATLNWLARIELVEYTT